MPVSYVEVSVDDGESNEQNNGGDYDDDDDKRRKKKKKEVKECGETGDLEKRNRLVIPSVPKTRKRGLFKIRKKPFSMNMSSSSPNSGSSSSRFWKKVCFCGVESPSTLESSSPAFSEPKGGNLLLIFSIWFGPTWNALASKSSGIGGLAPKREGPTT